MCPSGDVPNEALDVHIIIRGIPCRDQIMSRGCLQDYRRIVKILVRGHATTTIDRRHNEDQEEEGARVGFTTDSLSSGATNKLP